jgi:hypothetical protein
MSMGQRLLIVVPCGQRKIWTKQPNHGPAKAREVYTGAPFKVNKAFAEKFADRWVILSAKHGFIDPDFTIPGDYNVTFKKPSTGPIGIETLEEQSVNKNLHNYDIVIALGGEDYSSIVGTVFTDKPVVIPALKLPIGKAMKHLKTLTRLERTQMLQEVSRKP